MLPFLAVIYLTQQATFFAGDAPPGVRSARQVVDLLLLVDEAGNEAEYGPGFCFDPDPEVLAAATARVARAGGWVRIVRDPEEAVSRLAPSP